MSIKKHLDQKPWGEVWSMLETNKLISEKDIFLDKEHPSKEALNYSIISIKQHLDKKAWEKVINSCMLETNKV